MRREAQSPWAATLYGEKDVVDLLLEINGRYPLYDVKITITDFEKVKGIRNSEKYKENTGKGLSMLQSNQQFAGSRKILNIGNISANVARSLGTLELSSQGKQLYRINIEARNGFAEQHLKFIKLNGKWAMAQKLIVNGKLVREHSMPEFPKNENGQVDWSE